MEHTLLYLVEHPVAVGAVALSLTSVGYILAQRLKESSFSKGIPVPPGPPRDFLIGNLRQFPKDNFYGKFCEWQKEYGDIVSVELPGLPMVILNTYDATQEFLAKRPNTTSGRKVGYMVLKMMGMEWLLPFLQPGSHLSEQRKMLRRGIGPKRISSHSKKIERNAIRLMSELSSFEGNPRPLIMSKVGRIVIEVAYGKRILEAIGEDLLSWNSEQMHLLDEGFFRFWPVDMFNFLRFIPSWFPGVEFRKIGQRSTWLSNQIRYTPFEKAKELYESGQIGHSLATDLLDEFGPSDDVRDAIATLYLAGADTTSTAITAFFHAMYLFPEIARRVYEEIVSVTGGDRLPTIADRPALTYTEAVWKESFRWNTFTPLGLPHVNAQDEIFKGHLIRAGTMIYYNNGFILSDPRIWGDPEAFRPERFLTPNANTLPNPLVVIFGYGTRVCPGIYLADRAGFQMASAMAALYDVVPLEGRSRPKPETVEYTDTVLRVPKTFECRFVARNAKAEELLKTIALEY